MKSIPPIQKFMTTEPKTINADLTLADAHKIMSAEHIRHLPVLKGGRVVGLLSDRDVSLMMSIEGVDVESATVESAMTEKPYTISPDALLDEVAVEMSENRYGSAVVVQNHHVVGIFTAVDGLRALSELLHTRMK
jgi:acetoin utilization protein AcuB